MNKARALEIGYSSDKRKRRRQHRIAARNLLRSGGFFNGCSCKGSEFWFIANWHKEQALKIR